MKGFKKRNAEGKGLKMRTLQLKTDGKAIKDLQQMGFAIASLLAVLPLLMIFWISRSSPTAAPGFIKAMHGTSTTGVCLLLAYLTAWLLLSEGSIVKWLAIRKRLILFTRLFIKPQIFSMLYHSVKWRYAVDGKKTVIDLYPNGLVEDTANMGRKLSEYLGLPMLKYEESDQKARYVFGVSPERYDGMALMGEGIPGLTGRRDPKASYDPIPIYDSIEWNFTSEALHMLLIAPSGSGKTWFLAYLAGMALKRGHRVYAVDAKNSDFARVLRHSGVPVAAKTDEIIDLLTGLVQGMERRYSEYFASGKAGTAWDMESMGLQWHFLFFDEILSVLGFASRQEKAEIERLLGQLALKGRAAGFPVILTAQKLNATDLPKSITEQCQTRFILGGLVSDETFHQATGMYKKDIATTYKGGVGEGYAVTPKSAGLTYIRTPRLPRRLEDCVPLLTELKDRGAQYGDGF